MARMLADAMPETMLAMGFDAPGGPEVLRAERLPVPVPGVGQVLVKVAARLQGGLRDKDILARIGGDEFVAVLVDFEPGNDYEPILTRLLEAASHPALFSSEWLQVSASIGMTVFPQDRVDADQLMRHADQAMYVAKQQGRNRYSYFAASY